MKSLNEIPEAWRLAMQREKDALEFYSRMAQAATDEGTRSLFEMLVAQEKNHYAILEAEYRRIFPQDLPMYASIEIAPDADTYRRIARQLWSEGVDGIMLFNFFTTRQGGREPQFELLDELGDPDVLGLDL